MTVGIIVGQYRGTMHTVSVKVYDLRQKCAGKVNLGRIKVVCVHMRHKRGGMYSLRQKSIKMSCVLNGISRTTKYNHRQNAPIEFSQ